MALSDERFLVSGWEDDLNDINEEQKPHETPSKEILWACEKGELSVVKNLVEADPSLVHVIDDDGYSPLHRACYSNYVVIVSYLLEHGADVTARTNLRWQPLHSACQWGNVDCALLLLQAGADINAVTEGGQTPLHIAASHGSDYSMVQLLLMHPNIEPRLKNNNNETAYDIAKRSSNYYKIFEMSDDTFGGIR